MHIGIVLFALLAAVGYWVLQHAAKEKDAEVYIKRTGQTVGWALLLISLLGVAFSVAGACRRCPGPEMGRFGMRHFGMMGQPGMGPGGLAGMPGMQPGGQPQEGMMPGGDRQGQEGNGPKEAKDQKGARPAAPNKN